MIMAAGASSTLVVDESPRNDHQLKNVGAINNLNLTGELPPNKNRLGTGRQSKPFPHLLTSIHSHSKISDGDAGGNAGGNEFNLFSHQRLTQSQRLKMETCASLKEALLELYLSVKIRSDDEIDNYTEEQFKEEKKQMREVDGFTLIDYIKSSIEILMNMKIEDGGNDNPPHPHPFVDDEYEEEEEVAREERRRRKKEKKEAKKAAEKKPELAEVAGKEGPNDKKKRSIPKIDNHTPTSSIIDLQQKLD
jgi:hypothetical protein